MASNPIKPSQDEGDAGLVSGPFAIDFPSVGKNLKSQVLNKIPLRLNIWARMALFFFVIFAAAVCFVPWTQTVTVQGKLSSYFPTERPQEVHAQIKGRIIKWHVNEGDSVKEGDLVLNLGDIDPEFLAPDLILRLDESRKALEEQQEAALERANLLAKRLEEMEPLLLAAASSAEARVSEAENKVLNTEQRTAPAKGALETAKLNLERSRTLESKGLLSRRNLELAIQAVKEAEAEVKSAEAALRETQESRRALVHNREQINAEMVQRLLDTRSKRAAALSDFAEASKALADLELTRSNALQRQRASRVVAPFDGTVVRLSQVGPGEIVHQGTLLFTLVPKSATPAIEMWSNSIDAPLLGAGRPVRILFQGVPAIPLPAWPELMAGTYDGYIQVVDQSASENGRFRFWVVPDVSRRKWPPQNHVRQGTQAMGWVILNRVPLWYELWRRLNLFPPDYETGNISLKDVLLPKAGRSRK